jgi:hypothetical protein
MQTSIALPIGYKHDVGFLQVSCSASNVSMLADALDNLFVTISNCESVSAKLIGAVLLHDAVDYLNLQNVPSRKKMAANVSESLNWIRSQQHSNGGMRNKKKKSKEKEQKEIDKKSFFDRFWHV